jgi:bacteriorhodopsin
MTQFWLWTGVIGMALGALVFGIGAHNGKNQRWQILFTLNFFICAIASGLYLMMALGQGVTIINGKPTYWIRYVTWFCSTPLLILYLTYLGRTNLPITGSLLGANAYMIVTGFLATVSPKPISYIWYVVSCVAYLATAYLLLNQYRKQADRNYPSAKKAFRRLLTVHLVIWTLYPIVWIFCTEGFKTFGSESETMFFTLLDLASKVGFGFLSSENVGRNPVLKNGFTESVVKCEVWNKLFATAFTQRRSSNLCYGKRWAVCVWCITERWRLERKAGMSDKKKLITSKPRHC